MEDEYRFPVPPVDYKMFTRLAGLFGIKRFGEAEDRPRMADLEDLQRIDENLSYIAINCHNNTQLEPLGTLAFRFFPEEDYDYPAVYQTRNVLMQTHSQIMEVLKDDISIDWLPTPNNNKGIPFIHGKLLMKVGGVYQPFEYHKPGRECSLVRMNRLETGDLEKAVSIIADPERFEGMARIRSKKPHSIQRTILPFFAYSIGAGDGISNHS